MYPCRVEGELRERKWPNGLKLKSNSVRNFLGAGGLRPGPIRRVELSGSCRMGMGWVCATRGVKGLDEVGDDGGEEEGGGMETTKQVSTRAEGAILMVLQRSGLVFGMR